MFKNNIEHQILIEYDMHNLCNYIQTYCMYAVSYIFLEIIKKSTNEH